MLLLSAFFLAYILVVWLESNAFMWYGRFLYLDKLIPAFRRYLDEREKGNPSTFVEFIEARYGTTFLGELLTCPKCLSAWLGGVTGLLALPWTIPADGFALAVLSWLALPYLILFLYKLVK